MDLKEFFITPQGFSENDLSQIEGQTKANWLSEDAEGQLALDVYQTPDAIIVVTAVAGIDPKDLEISINNEVLTVRGHRLADKKIKDEDYYYRECYWGKFSRSVVLPVEVRQDKIEAIFKNGVLKIVLPKAKPERAVKIKIEEE